MVTVKDFDTSWDDASINTIGGFEISGDLLEDDDTEEIDLESSHGRLILMQEVEDLALTSDLVDDPDHFVMSDIFRLVGELQSHIALLEECELAGEEITQVQAEIIQELYNQLAIAVLEPVNLPSYFGPRRKDLILQDIGEEGKITIIQLNPPTTEPIKEPKSRYIHNSIPVQSPNSERTSQKTTTSHSVKPKTQVDQIQLTLQKMVTEIETAEVGFIDAWLNDYQSPYHILGDMPFEKIKQMTDASVHSPQYTEFKNLLDSKRIKYEVFNQWSQYFTDMEQLVERAKYKSFRQVIDAYLTVLISAR